MKCSGCGKIISVSDAKFCPWCGAAQLVKEKTVRATKSRGNGQGTAFKRGSTWTAQVTIGWKIPDDPSKPRYPVKRTKGGFRTKKEAIAYCEKLRPVGNELKNWTLQETFQNWKSMYESRIVPSTMGCYSAAYHHFSKLHGMLMRDINADDLQQCMDECPVGHRTHENMKCIAGLLWGYAFDQHAVERDITDNLFIGKGKSVQRDPITEKEIAAIKGAIGRCRYAEYVYALCYLGFRPGEFLELKKDMLHCTVLEDEETKEQVPVWFFVNGKKTEAGKDRIVIIPDQILEIVLDRMLVPGTDYVFPQYRFNRKKVPELVELKEMKHDFFNKHVFKPLMIELGFSGGKVPYCARHSYADKLKNASGSDKDKAQLIGHSQYLFTQSAYQSTAIADLKAVVDSLK